MSEVMEIARFRFVEGARAAEAAAAVHAWLAAQPGFGAQETAAAAAAKGDGGGGAGWDSTLSTEATPAHAPSRSSAFEAVLLGPDGDGVHTDLVRWQTAADAQAAMVAMERSEVAMAFMAQIDPASVQMSHLPVLVG